MLIVPQNVSNGNFTDFDLFENEKYDVTWHPVTWAADLTSRCTTLVESHGLNLEHLGPDTSINNT